MTEDIASPENPGPLLRVVKHQPIAFAIVGVANTAIGYVLFVIWSLILDNKDLYQVAVIGAYSISVLIAFVLHRGRGRSEVQRGPRSSGRRWCGQWWVRR